MSPVYLNPQPSSPIPFLELKGDYQQHSFQVFGYLHDDHLASSSSNNNNSSFSYNFDNCHTSQEILSLNYSRLDKKKVEKLVLSQEKASDLGQSCSSWLQSTVGDVNGSNSYGYSVSFQEEQKIENPNYNDQKSRKWKPSKVRIMQKMMATSKNSRDNNKEQLDHDLAKRQSSDGVRVCSDCHTTTTPLWRSGPQGPKSLCNACGIRQRKARRAAMAAAAAGGGFSNDTILASPPMESPKPKIQAVMKMEKVDHDKSHTLPLKKRSKIIDAARNNYTHNSHTNPKKHFFEDFALSSNKDYIMPTSKSSFPRDEEEGAILLMALSCGLACSSY